MSLDQPDQEGLSVGDRIAGEGRDVRPDLTAIDMQAWTRVDDIFGAVLNEREQMILRRHFGLQGEDARTMADIGKSMGLSRERVRQIEVSALSRLRKAI